MRNGHAIPIQNEAKGQRDYSESAAIDRNTRVRRASINKSARAKKDSLQFPRNTKILMSPCEVSSIRGFTRNKKHQKRETSRSSGESNRKNRRQTGSCNAPMARKRSAKIDVETRKRNENFVSSFDLVIDAARTRGTATSISRPFVAISWSALQHVAVDYKKNLLLQIYPIVLIKLILINCTVCIRLLAPINY